MEDTIIFSLIERSQFAQNSPVYEPGATVQQYMKNSGRQLSLLEYLLMETVRWLGSSLCLGWGVARKALNVRRASAHWPGLLTHAPTYPRTCLCTHSLVHPPIWLGT